MPLTHLLLALATVAIWGTNFVVMKLGLGTWPPLLFVALRFAFSALAALAVPAPKVPWRQVAAYGLFIGVGQFGLMLWALQRDITPGLASLVIQVQAFFTIGMSAVMHREPVRREHVAGLMLAATGIALIAWKSGALAGLTGAGEAAGASGAAGTVTGLGIGLVLLAALSWSAGNIVIKRIGPTAVLPLIAWSSLFPAVALFGLSLAIEGAPRIGAAFATAGLGAWAAVLWQATANTLVGYSAWSWLLARHPAVQVAPMALMVPVFGMGTSALVLGEPLPLWKIAAAGMVLGGLAVTVFSGRLRGRKT